jgi:hypothetical protein
VGVEESIVPRPAHAMNKSHRFLHFAHPPVPGPTTSLDYSDKSIARIRFVWHISGCARRIRLLRVNSGRHVLAPFIQAADGFQAPL